MLQRFPVESKGRRKKLQEVHFGFCWSEFFGYFCTNYMLIMYSAYLDAGWLCDYHMLFLFLDQMCHGKQLHFLWTYHYYFLHSKLQDVLAFLDT